MARSRFPGGTHPPEKKFAAAEPIREFPPPEMLSVPLSQHIGVPAAPTVKPKDLVARGQVIGEAKGFVSAPVHSPVSGTVLKIEKRPDPFGRPIDYVVIQNDGEERWSEGCDVERDYAAMSAEEIKSAVAAAGIVGMGGATFPTHVKLSPPPDKSVDTVILNGVECEPYLTCDHRLMLEKGREILEGFRLLKRALGASRGIVGIEANKPDAYEKMRSLAEEAGDGLEVELLPVRYPQGAEKQLIKALLDREVPSGGLPLDVGVVVNNVGTAYAVYQACAFGRPLIERVVTVTGEGVSRPANLLCRIGTPVRLLLDEAGLVAGADKVIFGGPMMGLAQYDLDLPVTKGSSGVLVLKNAKAYRSRACIRCGACVRGCPMRLVPSSISVACEAGAADLFEELNVLDCIECGVCTYVCPARRPIVHQIKWAKAVVASRRRKGA